MKKLFTAAACAVFLGLLPVPLHAEDGVPVHALAMHGGPKYGADFTHFEYANPNAPKGGELRLAAAGTFDSLNSFALKGIAAPGLSLTFQTLLINSDDEPFTEYGLIAQSVEMPEDRSWVVFNLRPEARWHDGRQITAEDVVWTFNALMTKGHPFYRAYYANVKESVAENPARVRFIFNMEGNRELPLIMGQMPVLPKHFMEGKDIESTTLDPILGSGPYKVKNIDAGRSITYARVEDWWAKDLPVVKGQYNFDTITYELYRDETVLLQALFSGEYDFRQENIAKAWSSEYDTAPVRQGLIKKVEVPHDIPQGMQAFVFNTRRAFFQDPKVREALQYAFDFEWSNKQFAFGKYKRTESYFSNSELASSGLPQGRELEILEKYRGKIPDAVFTQEFRVPKTSGSGRDMRANLAVAKKLLEEAGWKTGKSGMIEKDGAPFRFEILEDSPTFEKWINPFIANLKKIGIEANLRIIDTAQYQNRMDGFDFDMTTSGFGQSLSPGNEQRDFWGSDKADVRGSRNMIGVRNPVVDDLINMIISAPTREELVAVTRALDRVLLWNFYVIPQWHIDYHRLAYWDKFGRPETAPKYGLGVVDTWWLDPGKAAKIMKTAPAAGKNGHD